MQVAGGTRPLPAAFDYKQHRRVKEVAYQGTGGQIVPTVFPVHCALHQSKTTRLRLLMLR